MPRTNLEGRRPLRPPRTPRADVPATGQRGLGPSTVCEMDLQRMPDRCRWDRRSRSGFAAAVYRSGITDPGYIRRVPALQWQPRTI